MQNFREAEQNASVTVDNIAMVQSSIEAKTVDVNILNSNLTNFSLKFQGESTGTRAREENLLVVSNSTLVGSDLLNRISLNISRSLAVFSDVQISGVFQVAPVLEAVDSELVFYSSIFNDNNITRNHTGVLNFHGVKATFRQCTFEDNRSYDGHGGAIRATVESEITIDECSFTRNFAYYAGGAIHAVKNVKVNITNSNFTQNWAYHHGGAIASYHNTTLRIVNSNFMRNKAKISNGGCITLTNETNIYIKNGNFRGNSAGLVGGVIHVDKNNKLVIEDTEFRDNVAKLNSGVMSASYYSKVKFTNSKFINNTGTLTMSVLAVNDYVDIFIDRCLFENNPSAFTGLFEASRQTNTLIKNSNFTRNSANVGSLIEIGDSNFTVRNSRFYDNLGGSLVYGHYSANLSFTNCEFSNHSLAADPIMVISDANLKLDSSTFRNNTQYKEGAIVIGKSSCEINVTSCLFEENGASKGGAFYISRESRLFVDNSTFKNNHAGDGGIGYFLDSNGTFTYTYIYNTTGTGYGGVLTALNSKLIVKNSNFSTNKAIFGGCFYLEINSSLAAFDSTFEESGALQGGAIYKNGPGNVSLENCTLGNNQGDFGGAIYASDIDYLRLAKGSCRYLPVPNRGCLTLECDKKKFKCELYTYNYTISNQTYSVNSNADKNFSLDAHKAGMVYRRPWTPHVEEIWRETPYASCELTLI